MLKKPVKDQSFVSSKDELPAVSIRLSCPVVNLTIVFVSMETVKLRKIKFVNKLILDVSTVWVYVAPNDAPLLKTVWKLNFTVFDFAALIKN